MQHSLTVFADWLSSTALSLIIQSTSWIIPAMQSVHILSIAIVMSSALMVSLRVLGIAMRDQAVAEVVQRFLPWLWVALIVLLVTGTVLIIGEPGRSLTNSVFQLKMALLVGVLACTLLLRRAAVSQSMAGGDLVLPSTGSKLVAVVSLTLWTGIIFAGRWIAYAGDALE